MDTIQYMHIKQNGYFFLAQTSGIQKTNYEKNARNEINRKETYSVFLCDGEKKRMEREM